MKKAVFFGFFMLLLCLPQSLLSQSRQKSKVKSKAPVSAYSFQNSSCDQFYASANSASPRNQELINIVANRELQRDFHATSMFGTSAYVYDFPRDEFQTSAQATEIRNRKWNRIMPELSAVYLKIPINGNFVKYDADVETMTVNFGSGPIINFSLLGNNNNWSRINFRHVDSGRPMRYVNEFMGNTFDYEIEFPSNELDLTRLATGQYGGYDFSFNIAPALARSAKNNLNIKVLVDFREILSAKQIMLLQTSVLDTNYHATYTIYNTHLKCAAIYNGSQLIRRIEN